MQSWCKIWPPNGSSRARAKQKLPRKRTGAWKSSWNPIGILKSFTLTIPLEFGKVCEDLSWNHCTSTPHRSETKGGPERAVRRVQYCCNQVWMKNGWQIPWNAKPICETLKISCLMGRLHTRDVLENLSKDRSFRFGSLVEYYPISAKDQSRIHQFGKKDLTWIVPWIRFLRGGEFGRATYWLQTLKSWKRWTHRKSTQKRLNAKEVIFPKENGKFIFPVADGRIKFVGGDQELRTSTLIRDHPIRGEGRRGFHEESERSPPPSPQDSNPDAGEAINDFWSMSGNFIHIPPSR